MKIKDVIAILEEWAPTAYAEDFDNVGLLVGKQETEVSGILVTLDTIEEVVDEAISLNCNMIVSFHPIVFKGLKRFNGKTYVERALIKAIKNDIAIFAIHTALDNYKEGVNDMICEQLHLKNRKILIPQAQNIKKLITYAPSKEADALKQHLFNAGAGNIGNYDQCSFTSEGFGTFRASDKANPSIGNKGEMHTEAEAQIQVTFPKHIQSKLLQTLHKHHSYEEVAYEITTLENKNQNIGMGMIGELESPIDELDFLKTVKSTFRSGCLRHSKLLGKPIHKVAVLGGSGSFAIKNAIQNGADIFITADLKYHQFYEAENKIVLADIGHYESEQYTKNLIVGYLRKKISNFAPALTSGRIILSDINTNPIQYI